MEKSPRELAYEIEGFISAGARDEEIRAALPLNSRNLLAVVRVLVDELHTAEGKIPEAAQ